MMVDHTRTIQCRGDTRMYFEINDNGELHVRIIGEGGKYWPADMSRADTRMLCTFLTDRLEATR